MKNFVIAFAGIFLLIHFIGVKMMNPKVRQPSAQECLAMRVKRFNCK